PRGKLRSRSRQNVDNAARNIARRQHLGQADRAQRRRLTRDNNNRVARDKSRGDNARQSEKRRILRSDDRDNTRRLRRRDVEKWPTYSVAVAGNLHVLVGPTRIPNPGVDRVIDLALGHRIRHALLAANLVNKLGPAALENL